MRNKNPGFKTPSAGQCCPKTFVSSFCRLCSYGLRSLEVAASSDSSLNEDLKGLAPKHCKSLKKLPEICQQMSQNDYFILENCSSSVSGVKMF